MSVGFPAWQRTRTPLLLAPTFGFSIAGLLWVVSRDRSQVRVAPIIGMLSSIIPLGLAALIYSELPAELNCRRAVTDVFTANLALGIGTTALIFYLGDLLVDFVDEATHPAAGSLDDAGAKWLIGFVRVIIAALSTAGAMSSNYLSLDLVDNSRWLVAVFATAVFAAGTTAATTHEGSAPTVPGWLRQRVGSHARAFCLVCVSVALFALTFAVTLGFDWRTDAPVVVAAILRVAVWCMVLLVLFGWRRTVPVPVDRPENAPP